MQVSAIVVDTRKLVPQCIFVAIRGAKADGHQFLAEAVAKGAIVLVVEDAANVPAGFRGFVQKVPSSRLELARLASVWASLPSQNLFTVGVTGTNGKTTTTHMIESVLNAGSIPTGVIGTIDHHFGSKVWPTELTTPDPMAFQMRLKEFVKLGAKAVALEVSSHALMQSRVDFVEFNAGVFSNLTRDHLDYHGTMENYFEAKVRFFSELLTNSKKKETFAILNGDDDWVLKARDRLLKRKRSTIWTFANAATPASKKLGKIEFTFEIVEQSFEGVRFKLKTPGGTHSILLPMTGLHNVQNAVSAFAVGLAAGIDERQLVKSLGEIPGVNCRLESVRNSKGVHVFVDFAHTDEGLVATLKTLTAIRESAAASGRASATAKIITVFGCGGDRDRGKRPLMMRAALDGSDKVVVTSDNPRNEDPEVILDDAMAAVKSEEKAKVQRIADRRKAIERAIEAAAPGDVVLIAGKGHETTQQIGAVKHPFSDARVAREILEGEHA